MYGLYEVAPDLVQIALPSAPDVPRPFGFPANVWVLRGMPCALVGTGPLAARPALLAALQEAGLAPHDFGKILLTSPRPEQIGNVEIFENAVVHLVGRTPSFDVASHHDAMRAELADVMYRLVTGDDGNPDWEEAAVDRFMASYFGGLPENLAIAPVVEGERVAAAETSLRVIATPGADPDACCYLSADGERLFGGETALRSPPPRIRSPKDFTDTLDRLSPLRPDLILPAHGGVERSYFALFRALNLSVANLVQNMPFALNGPTSVARIAYQDLGYWPRDVVRFAAHVLQFKVMLDELVNSGVAEREGDGPWAVYAMERPPRA